MLIPNRPTTQKMFQSRLRQPIATTMICEATVQRWHNALTFTHFDYHIAHIFAHYILLHMLLIQISRNVCTTLHFLAIQMIVVLMHPESTVLKRKHSG